MSTHTFPFIAKVTKLTVFGTACILGSFYMGAQTTSDVSTHVSGSASALEASLIPTDTAMPADTGHGTGRIGKAASILRVVTGHEPLPEHWQDLDSNHDGVIDANDALVILETLTR